MVPEETEGEELQNNSAETLEQSEPEETPQTEAEESVPATEEPEIDESDPVFQAAYKRAQSRFTPAQQAARAELQQEREQRAALERRLQELEERVKAPAPEPTEPEDPEPDPVMDNQAWLRWAARQEAKQAILPLLQQQKFQAKCANDDAFLSSKYPALRDRTSAEAVAFANLLKGATESDRNVVQAYRQGLLNAEQLFLISQGTGIQATAEKKVKEDLVRKVKAQVAPPKGTTAPKTVKFTSMDDAIKAAMQEHPPSET